MSSKLWDFHLHTDASGDSRERIDEVVRRAIELEMPSIAITDHYDYDYPDAGFCEVLDFPSYERTLKRVIEQYKSQIEIVPGLEVGLRVGAKDKLARALSTFNYGFILGSIHSVDDYCIDFSNYSRDLGDRGATRHYYEYFYQAIMANMQSFDVCGHLNVIDRYVGRIQPDAVYMDIVEEIFKELVNNGKGIEINTSSFRYGMGERTTPTQAILDLFVSLGGEIITIGSDAHRARDVGDKLDVAVSMVKRAGLDYIATYRDRQAIFHRI